MKHIPASQAAELSAQIPESTTMTPPQWLEGPHNGDRLDVGIATFAPGAVVPPHIHLGGQVIVVTAGRGFVETDGERVEVTPGDIVICPAGELHTHGAVDDESFAHLTVTTGGYSFPDGPPTIT
ncbi:MAG: cupin domain-containing protein [Acidimicrobiia bacterium]